MEGRSRTPGRVVGWGTVCLLTVLLFPVGLYFIRKKTKAEPMHYEKNGRLLLALGGACALLAALYLAMGLLDQLPVVPGQSVAGNAICLLLIFGSGSVLFLKWGAWAYRRGRRFSTYLVAVGAGPVRALPTIARLCRVTTGTALADLEQMLQAGYFPGASLDRERQLLMLPEKADPGKKPRVWHYESTGAPMPQDYSGQKETAGP